MIIPSNSSEVYSEYFFGLSQATLQGTPATVSGSTFNRTWRRWINPSRDGKSTSWPLPHTEAANEAS